MFAFFSCSPRSPLVNGGAVLHELDDEVDDEFIRVAAEAEAKAKADEAEAAEPEPKPEFEPKPEPEPDSGGATAGG